jgi:EpsI family protein
MEVGAWRGESADRFDQQVLTALGVDEYVNRIYSAPGRPPVGLYIGFYRSQRQGDTMHSPLNCLPGAGWEPVASARVTLRAAGRDSAPPAARPGGSVTVNRALIEKGPERQVVLYWYQSHGRVTASEYWSKIYTVLDAIRLNRTDAALVRVITPVADASSPASQAASERAAMDFVNALLPVLSGFLPG